jgi:hypothetical protein
MRKAICDLKKKCKSLKNQVKNVGGKKVYRMLHSINERNEDAVPEIEEDLVEEEEEEEKKEEGKRDESPIIGHADKREIVRVF